MILVHYFIDTLYKPSIAKEHTNHHFRAVLKQSGFVAQDQDPNKKTNT